MKKFLILALSGLFNLNVYANGCPGQFDPQSGICRFQGHNGELVQYNIAPPQGNTSPQKKIIETTIIHKASKYGALASNKKTGAVGGVINMNSLSEAKKGAIKRCEDGGKHTPCKVIAWVRNGCIAGVADMHRNKLFRATGKPGDAEQLAMSYCKKSGSTNCEIVLPEACSVPDGMYN